MKSVEIKHLPSSSPGTIRTVSIIRYGSPGSRPKVYIQAGLHADEAPGFVVLHHLNKQLEDADSRGEINGEIVVVPVANPIGLSQWRDDTLQGRFDFSNSINFNRQHHDLAENIAKKIGPLLTSEPKENVAIIRACTADILADTHPEDEAGSLKHLLISFSHDADIVLDLHCDLQALMHVYLGTPLWPDGADLAAQLRAEVILLASDSGGTPFDEANSRLWWTLAEKFPSQPIPPACFSATIELRGIADTSHSVAMDDASNIFSFLQRRGSIQGNCPELPDLINGATPLTGVDYVKASTPGVVVFLKKPGDWIRKDEIIAEVINPQPDEQGSEVCKVKSLTAGLLFSRNTDRFARPGRVIAKIAGTTPLREPDGNLLTL